MRELFELFLTFLIGILVGALMSMLIANVTPGSYKNIVNDAIKDCEKSLPRDQHCTIVAIPPSKD
jgi:uncharacterized membrane-anchored protein YhcB (DUF1043 family)